MRLRAIITDYASRQAEIRQVRDEVFILEQKVDRAEEFDGRDQLCSHVLVFDDERPVATGRIDLEKGGKIGRVAVLQSYRRQGIGKLAMQQLEAVASEAGAERLWFHAQTQAVPFYLSLGYQVCSQEFMEANIPHVKMERALPPRDSRFAGGTPAQSH